MIEKIFDGLYRILIPFEDLTTTVYVVHCKAGVAIIDCATYPSDIDEYVLPALEEQRITKEDVKYLLLTHSHADHAGGLSHLQDCFPWAKVYAHSAASLVGALPLADGQTFLDTLRAIHLPGHSPDAVGYVDTRTMTLLSGDCLQLAGVGKYRSGITDVNAYVQTVGKLEEMCLSNIIAAHTFDPLGSTAYGRAAVEEYLSFCRVLLPK